MGRPPRLHVARGFYHVTVRGNHQEALFDSAADRGRLDELVHHGLRACGAELHAFCWMSNHLHMLVRVNAIPLGRFVQRVAGRYARYRHRSMHATGHLFQGRHDARLIDTDPYFLDVLRYIHRNPVAAGLVDDAEAYRWSSHRAYLGLENIPWLTTDFGLQMFSEDRRVARAAYLRFMTVSDTVVRDTAD
jgi:REP element-mobilizing transposase RayT